MTDRHAGYVVVLDDSLREDDAQATLNALRQIKGVIAVEPVVDDAHAVIARNRAYHDLEARLWAALREGRS
jgi:nitrate reductase NapAB chaperone NapD